MFWHGGWPACPSPGNQCHGIFPINTTSHSESLRHGFSTRIHSQTRWRLKNDTQLAGDILHWSGKETVDWNRLGVFHKLILAAGKRTVTPGWLSWEEDPQSSPGAQIYIALCFGSQDAQTPGPRRSAVHSCGCHGNTTRMASTRRGGTLYVQNVGIKNMRNFNNCEQEEARFRLGKCCVGRLRPAGVTVPSAVLTSAKHGLKLKSPFFGSNLYKYTQVVDEALQLHL